MKVLIINGSPRKNGVTSTILTALKDNISPIHTIEYFNVNKLNIKPCIGCFKCRPDKVCIRPYDDAHLRGAIRALKTILKSGGIKIIKTLNIPDTNRFEQKKEKYLKIVKKIADSYH